MSDYVPTDWVDNVTPVDAARMDHIEAGIDLNRDAIIDHETRLDAVEADLPTKQETSEKGAANGYTPLGADTKVPAIYLPTSGGAIDYENAWVAGTAYQPGDVVIHNGIEYLAVNPSTGQTPPPSPAVAGATVIPLVTTLPASPFDGQEVDLTDSLLTPSWVWRFRYVAAAPTNKWKFVGGMPRVVEVVTSEASPLTTFADWPTPGPIWTPPLAGEYEIRLSAHYQGAAPNAGTMAVKIGAAATQEGDGVYATASLAGQIASFSRTFRKTLAVAELRVQSRQSSGSGASLWSNRVLAVTPVAVG
jgi:hypothetical protein